jgi:hypothetical protein
MRYMTLVRMPPLTRRATLASARVPGPPSLLRREGKVRAVSVQANRERFL